MADTARTLLAVNNVEVIYDHVILVLKGVSLRVAEGGIVALLGANGAGKSTTLKGISGLLRTERGDVTKGTVEFLGEPIHRKDPAEVVGRGIVQVMEGRHEHRARRRHHHPLSPAGQGGRRRAVHDHCRGNPASVPHHPAEPARGTTCRTACSSA